MLLEASPRVPRLENPNVLVTRPQDSSARFVQDLGAMSGPFQPLISPAFELAGTDADVPEFDCAVFTSQAGVRFAPSGQGRIAYCVGDATATNADHAGYITINAQGDVSDLIALILRQAPRGKVLHIRGETSVGDVTDRLKDGGLEGQSIVAYSKVPHALSARGAVMLAHQTPTILPLFSAETVSIMMDWNVNFSHIHVVAISPVVAAAAEQLNPAFIHTSATTNQAAMIVATSSLIA